jgi:predicted nucleic acid-binding Zn ribbon protein
MSTSMPSGYSTYTCDSCAERNWEVAVGSYSDQLALICNNCDSVVHIIVNNGDLEFQGDS